MTIATLAGATFAPKSSINCFADTLRYCVKSGVVLLVEVSK